MKKPYQKKYNFQHQLSQQIIEKLVKPERLAEKNIWGRELKILKKLLLKYPNTKFWVQLDLGYTLNSLAFLLSQRGEETLNQKWGHFIIEKPAETEYDFGTKTGEDIVEKKPKTLIELLS